MELTRQADYALRCVLETARHERISARELAASQSLSPSFVGKIVSALARAGILETHRGASGGVQLGRPAATISVLEVVEAVQGPIRLNRCVRTPPACVLVETCALSPVIRSAQDAVVEALSVSLEQVLDGADTSTEGREAASAAASPAAAPNAAPAAAVGTAPDAHPRAVPAADTHDRCPAATS